MASHPFYQPPPPLCRLNTGIVCVCCKWEHADTTDVQNITVAVITDHSVPGMVKVQCGFIPGSDAQGRIVILVMQGITLHLTLNLTRIGTLLTACGNESLQMTASLKDVLGFDIESDGTIGSTQVPGIITSVASSTEFDTLCQP